MYAYFVIFNHNKHAIELTYIYRFNKATLDCLLSITRLTKKKDSAL